jgi:hypothetical protein
VLDSDHANRSISCFLDELWLEDKLTYSRVTHQCSYDQVVSSCLYSCQYLQILRRTVLMSLTKHSIAKKKSTSISASLFSITTEVTLHSGVLSSTVGYCCTFSAVSESLSASSILRLAKAFWGGSADAYNGLDLGRTLLSLGGHRIANAVSICEENRHDPHHRPRHGYGRPMMDTMWRRVSVLEWHVRKHSRLR